MAYQFDTYAVHAGQAADERFAANAAPIHLSTSFAFKNVEQAQALFNMEQAGHVDTHISNSTNAVLEERIAALEGGVGTVSLASGQAALHAAIITLMGSGGHIVASRSMPGASRHLLEHTLPRLGIATTCVDPRDLNAWRNAIRTESRLLLGATLGSLGLEVLNLHEVAAIAHERSLPLMVDNTLTTPWLTRPLDHGADLVVHCAAQFLGGHGIATGGLLVDGGRFEWHRCDGKFPTLSEPDDGFNGLNFGDESSVAAFLLRARHESLHDFGACMSAMSAFQLLQGMETLPLRMERHVANTRRVIECLLNSNLVEQLISPELEDHPDHALAQTLMPRGAGSVLHVSLKGGLEAARKLIEALRVFSHSTAVGATRSSAILPASTTMLRIKPEVLAESQLHSGTVRLSIGLEDATDLIEDLERGLHAAARA